MVGAGAALMGLQGLADKEKARLWRAFRFQGRRWPPYPNFSLNSIA